MNTLDSVVDALARDPARKFVVVEQVSGALTCRLHSTSHSACVASPSAPLFCRLGSYNARVLSLQSKFGSILVLEKIVRFKPKRACTCTPLINLLEFQVFAVRVHIVGY
jgi:hypothetical protein